MTLLPTVEWARCTLWAESTIARVFDGTRALGGLMTHRPDWLIWAAAKPKKRLSDRLRLGLGCVGLRCGCEEVDTEEEEGGMQGYGKGWGDEQGG